MTVGYTLTREAALDLQGIGEFTTIRWGLAQAVTYLDGMNDLLGRLFSDPALSRDVSDLKPGLFRARYEQHFVFFTRKLSAVTVLRVLHERMDFVRHL